MKFVLSDFVGPDPEEIGEYIAHDSPDRAQTFLSELTHKIRSLRDNSSLYRLRPDIGKDARVASHGEYVILFLANSDTITVLRVIHGARELPLLFWQAQRN